MKFFLPPAALFAARRSFSNTATAAALSRGAPIRWGILSAGKISSDYVKAIAQTEGNESAAVAARSSDRAASFAAAHGIAKSYGSYDELLADPDIDVVYVGSVADQHLSLATQALLANKPTVVEKPLALTLQESQTLIQLSKQQNVFLMEGMWTRCFPAMLKVRELIQNDTIGKIVTVQADFGWSTEGCGTDDRIWHPTSGGMTLDIGMYMAQLGQVAYAGASVTNLQAMGSPKNGIDHTALTNVQYSNGGYLQFYVTGQANTEERVVIQGTKGRIIIDPPAHVPTVVRVQLDQGRGDASEEVLEYPLIDDSYTKWNYPGSIGFMHQIKAVGEALRNGERQCRHYTHGDSLQVASMMDQILTQFQQANDALEEDVEETTA
jgi:dihydrodiol dehydrogenase / D-xylose 1-dehydrogenase (NADP)